MKLSSIFNFRIVVFLKTHSIRVYIISLCLLLLFACKIDDPATDENSLELEKSGELGLENTPELLAELWPVLQGFSHKTDVVYGIDMRIGKAYMLSLSDGRSEYLFEEGRGPGEVIQPIQLTLLEKDALAVYDNLLNVIAIHKNGEPAEKYPGFSEHDVWVRGRAGYYWSESIVTSIVEPEFVRSMDFENARPLALFDFKNNELVKAGKFSPTVDELDSDGKYPLIYLDRTNELVYYLFVHDHTIMAYDLNSGESSSMSSHLPGPFRVKTKSVAYSQPGNINSARELGLDRSVAIGLSKIDNQLIAVWQNFKDSYYDNLGDYSKDHVDYFGVVYNMPDLSNPREFKLEGRYLGTHKNRLMIDISQDPGQIVIGFYDFVDINDTK
jgi:hypothetical protein